MTIAEICKTFANCCKISLKYYFWTLHVEHVRTIILDTAKIHKLLPKTETSDVSTLINIKVNKM